MANKKVAGLKSSEIHLISAKIIELCERVNPDVVEDMSLQPAKENGKLMMTLLFSKISIEQLTRLSSYLSTFKTDVFGKGKSGVFLKVEGTTEDFKKLIPNPPTSSSTPTPHTYAPNLNK